MTSVAAGCPDWGCGRLRFRRLESTIWSWWSISSASTASRCSGCSTGRCGGARLIRSPSPRTGGEADLGRCVRGRGRLARAQTGKDQRDEAALDLDIVLDRMAAQRRHLPPGFPPASSFPTAHPCSSRCVNDLQRATTSIDNVVKFPRRSPAVDASSLLAPKVRCPTSILHSRGDLRVPQSQARELAALIPDSRLAERRTAGATSSPSTSRPGVRLASRSTASSPLPEENRRGRCCPVTTVPVARSSSGRHLHRAVQSPVRPRHCDRRQHGRPGGGARVGRPLPPGHDHPA